MKNYPCVIAGCKAAMCFYSESYNDILIGFKVSHRKGQSIKVRLTDESNWKCTINVQDYPTYVRIVCHVKANDIPNIFHAIQHCKEQIVVIHKCVNFDANMDLVTKELLNILG